MIKRILKSTLLALLLVAFISTPVLASYYALLQVVTTTTAYDMLPVIQDVDNTLMVTNNYIDADGRDVDIEKSGVPMPRMLADDKTLFASAFAAGSTSNFYYTTDNTPSDFDILTGYGGNITITDDDTLELVSDFEIEQSGYVDTTDSNFAYLDKKRGAYSNPITDTGEISGVIYLDEPEELIPPAYNNWEDVDVSAYVPGHATGIVVHLTNTAGAARDVGVRMNGSVDALVGDLQTHGWSIVGIDANDIFDLFLEDATCHAYLVGFTGSDFTFKVAADDISLGVALAWTDIDISAEAPNATGAIIAVINTHIGNNFDWGVRKKGSGDTRWERIIASGISWAVIGCDTSQVIEGYVGTLDVDFYLVGYTTNNVNFFTNGIDKSLAAGLGMWTDIDCSGDVTGFTTHIIFEVLSDAPFEYGFRRNGSIEDIHSDITWHFWVIVECDENQIVQGWAEAINVDWWIIGYIEGYVDNPYEVNATATGISSDEYTVTTYGVANEPAWATGDVLHFTGAADSNVNAGAINDNIAKLWVSLWFNLDSTFSAASATDQFIWGKFIGAADYVYAYLESDDGILYFQFDDGVNPFSLESTTVSWTADTWYHIITSLSDTAPAQRLLVNGAAQDTDTVAASNTPNGGDFCFGDFDDPGAVTGFIGEIQNVIVGTDDLTSGAGGEEAALYAGIAPGDEINYWYTDEGTGTGVDAVIDYGSAPSDGDVDAACSWETATYTTGLTGRLCDFYIEVDDGVTDADRWGANLKGASVPANANDWLLNQNNVMPYMEYYKHTVGGVEHAWYQPNDIVEATDYDGTASGGTATTIIDAGLTQVDDYWNNALVTITGAGAAAPEGETSVVTDFDDATNTLTVAPAFSDVVQNTDTYTVDFGTLIDRSYYGLEFVATDSDRILLDNEITLGANTTINLWFWTDDFTNNGLFMENIADTFDDYLFLQYPYRFKAEDTIDTALVFDVPAMSTGWHMLTFGNDGSFWFLYLDGVASANVEAYIAVMYLQYFGKGYSHYFSGTMDDISIYNRAWEQAEVTDMYNSGTGRYTPYDTDSLILQLHMEEGSGVDVTDSSGEGNDGTITGATWVNGKVPRPAGNAGTNDSRITWGVNPSDITTILGSLYSTVVTVPATAGVAQDIIPETPVITLFGMTAPDNMFSPLFDTFAGIINLPSVILWVTVSMLFVVGGTVGFYFLTKNGTYSAFVGVFLLAICVVMGTVPWWTIIIGMLLAIYAAIAKSRQVA